MSNPLPSESNASVASMRHSPSGAHRSGQKGACARNNPTPGVPIAVAMCNGPVLDATTLDLGQDIHQLFQRPLPNCVCDKLDVLYPL